MPPLSPWPRRPPRLSPHHKMVATPESLSQDGPQAWVLIARWPQCLSLIARWPPRLSLAKSRLSPRFPQGFFFFLWGGGYNTQAPADSELGPRWRKRIASMLDHPLMSVRTADIPVVSMLTSPAGIPLSTTLPVMAVAILSMWASHCPRVCSRCLSCSQVCCRTSWGGRTCHRTSRGGGAHSWTPSLPCHSHRGCPWTHGLSCYGHGGRSWTHGLSCYSHWGSCPTCSAMVACSSMAACSAMAHYSACSTIAPYSNCSAIAPCSSMAPCSACSDMAPCSAMAPSPAPRSRSCSPSCAWPSIPPPFCLCSTTLLDFFDSVFVLLGHQEPPLGGVR